MHVLSCFFQVKSILLISCVFWILLFFPPQVLCLTADVVRECRLPCVKIFSDDMLMFLVYFLFTRSENWMYQVMQFSLCFNQIMTTGVINECSQHCLSFFFFFLNIMPDDVFLMNVVKFVFCLELDNIWHLFFLSPVNVVNFVFLNVVHINSVNVVNFVFLRIMSHDWRF